MKLKELKALNNSDLDSKMTELRKELMKAGSQIATGTAPKSPGRVKEMRRAVAKILTIRQMNAANAAQKNKGGSKKE